MAQRKITYPDKSNAVPVIDRDTQATAEDFQDIKDVNSDNVDDINSRFKQAVINLVANVSYPQPNLHTATNAIPRMTQLKGSDGTNIIDAYLSTNQATGVTTINVGANFSNAIFISIGW